MSTSLIWSTILWNALFSATILNKTVSLGPQNNHINDRDHMFVRICLFLCQMDSISKLCFTWALEELLVRRPVGKTKSELRRLTSVTRSCFAVWQQRWISVKLLRSYLQPAWIWAAGCGLFWPHESGFSPLYCGWHSWHNSAASHRAWEGHTLQEKKIPQMTTN